VGIYPTIPTVPNEDPKYWFMSGSTMAAAALSGFCAALLSRTPAILHSTRDANRASKIVVAVD